MKAKGKGEKNRILIFLALALSFLIPFPTALAAYPEKPVQEWVEFDSMINVRPSSGNRSRYVESSEIRAAVMKIVNLLVEG